MFALIYSIIISIVKYILYYKLQLGIVQCNRNVMLILDAGKCIYNDMYTFIADIIKPFRFSRYHIIRNMAFIL